MDRGNSLMTTNRKAKLAAHALKAAHGISLPEAMQHASTQPGATPEAFSLPAEAHDWHIIKTDHPKLDAVVVIALHVDDDRYGEPIYAITVHPRSVTADDFDYRHDLTDGDVPEAAIRFGIDLADPGNPGIGFPTEEDNADDLEYVFSEYITATYETYLPRYLDTITTADDFATNCDNGEYPFVESATGLGLVGYGHTDKSAFAAALTAECADEGTTYTADEIVHTMAHSIVSIDGDWGLVAPPAGSVEDGIPITTADRWRTLT